MIQSQMQIQVSVCFENMVSQSPSTFPSLSPFKNRVDGTSSCRRCCCNGELEYNVDSKKCEDHLCVPGFLGKFALCESFFHIPRQISLWMLK